MELVGGGFVINGATPSSFSLDPWLKKKHIIYPWLGGSVAKNKSII